jgi:hypothetical protein
MELAANRLSKQAHNKLYHGKQIRACGPHQQLLETQLGDKKLGKHTLHTCAIKGCVDIQNCPECIIDITFMFLSSRRYENILGLLHLVLGRRKQLFGCWISQLPQMQEWTSPLCSSCWADRKTYMDCLVWSPDELIINFRSFSPRISSKQSA